MTISASVLFQQTVNSGRHFQIKLLGDSITHGVGGSHFEQNGEKITDGFARNPDGYCWANLFRDEMEARYPCTVINNACTGTNIEFIMTRFHELVSEEDDLVLCTIGTNNRHQFFTEGPKHTPEEHMEIFYQNILKLNRMFAESGKAVIFIANIPASAENEQDGENYWRLFHMKDVNALYRKASQEVCFPMLSLYEAFGRYCEERNRTVDSLLSDGLHPNNEGHRVICGLLTELLGL